MNIFKTTGLVAALVLPAALADARPLPVITEQTETAGFLGLSIPLSGEGGLRVSVGVRKATVQTDGSLTGSEVRLSIDPRNPMHLQLRAMALGGTVDHAGGIGAGWDFGAGKPFATLGIILPHLTGTADIGLDGLSPQFGLGLDSLGAFDAPKPFDPCNQSFGPNTPQGC